MQMKLKPRIAGLLTAVVCCTAIAQDVPQDGAPVFELSPFVVRDEAEVGYATTTSLGASRIALPVTDIPTSVISLNERIFEDRAAVDGMEVLGLVSGIQQGADGSPGQAGFSLRGFSVVGLRIRDGLPEVVEGVDYAFDDAAAYESLEVIKGPAGTLYGTTSMGGVVNKISKWPRFAPETRLEFQVQGGSDEFIRGMVDTTGPINERNAYRAVVSMRRGNRHFDESKAPNDFTNTMLAFTHRVGPEDRFTGQIWGRVQYMHFELDREQGDPFITGHLDPQNPGLAPVVRNPLFASSKSHNANPEDDVSKANIVSLESGYEHWFDGPVDGNWTLRLVGRYSHGRGDKSPSYAMSRPTPVDADGQIVQYTNANGDQVNGDNRFISADDPRVADWRSTRTMREFDGYTKNSGMFVDLVGKFVTGALSHQMVINAQVTQSERERAFFFWAMPNPDNTTAVANSYSVINPDFSNYNREQLKATVPMQFNPFNGNSRSNEFAAGFQNNIGMFEDRLIFVVGARYDTVKNTSYSFDSDESIAQYRFVPDYSTTQTTSNQEWTHRYGIVGKPIPGLSIFGQVGQTYIPVNTLDQDGNKFPNRMGEIREIGIKTDLFNGRLVATASYFDMELTNVLISVPNPPELGGGTILQPVGTQDTDGYEIDVAWNPMPGLDMLLAYSKITSTSELGRSFRGVPIDASWSAMVRYAFQDGAMQGLFLGMVWKHGGRFAGDVANTFYVDNSDLFDGFIGYRRDRWTLQLNVNNLFNSDDIITTVSDTAAFRALDRTYRVTLRYTF